MPDYDHSLTVYAAPADVFAFVSDVANLPAYLPTTKSAQPDGQGRVRVEGEANDQPYDADGEFRVMQDQMRLEWRADERYYSGWLTVQDDDGGNSLVTVQVSWTQQPQVPEQNIREGLQASLASVRNLVEGKGGKVEPEAAT